MDEYHPEWILMQTVMMLMMLMMMSLMVMAAVMILVVQVTVMDGYISPEQPAHVFPCEQNSFFLKLVW